MMRIYENEGYIQMSFQNKTKSKQFNIPNKEYYHRKKAKQIYQTFQEQDLTNNIYILIKNICDFIKIRANMLL